MKPRQRLSATALVIAVLASVWYCNGEASEEGRWVLELKSLSTNPLVISIPVRVGDFVRLRHLHPEKYPGIWDYESHGSAAG